ncbi:MAG TPA: hypothetical protein VMG12_31155, partial [Polyangiaceae bacterium]|nr:hypothetical protein [Polyangiaceae bacterium]
AAASSSEPAHGPASAGGSARARRRGPGRTSRVWAGLSLAAAAAVALGVGLRGLDRGERDATSGERADGAPAANGTRTKGGAVALGFVVRRAGITREGQAGVVLHPGDVLRFTLGASRAGYAGVWNLDAAGGVTALIEGDALVPVTAEQRQVLPGAAELDASLGDERLVAVLCERPLSNAEVGAALAASAEATRLPPGCQSDSVPIRKERP